VQDLSQDEERTWTVAETEADHLDEGQDDCEDVEGGHEDLDEGDEQERDDDDSLPLHHEGSAAVLLQELASEQRHPHLHQVQVHEDRQHI